MNRRGRPDLQRLRYRRGQVLSGRDLRDEGTFADERRWWHNRAIHQANGVAMGMRVEPSSTLLGDLSVTVSPGVGYDCFGRAILHREEVTLDFPSSKMTLPQAGIDSSPALLAMAPVPGAPLLQPVIPILPIWGFPPFSFRFTIAQQSLIIRRGNGRKGDQPCPSVPEPCCGSGTGSRAPDSSIEWSDPNDPVPTDAVLVARVRLDLILSSFGGVTGVLPVIDANYARPLAKPYISSGATMVGRTSWVAWPAGATPLGFKTTIDTSAAGFTEPPLYFAQLQGKSLDLSDPTFVPLLHSHVAGARSDKFEFRLWMPEMSIPGSSTKTNEGFESVFQTYALQNGLFVSWLGIQPGRSPFESPVQAGGAT